MSFKTAVGHCPKGCWQAFEECSLINLYIYHVTTYINFVVSEYLCKYYFTSINCLCRAEFLFEKKITSYFVVSVLFHYDICFAPNFRQSINAQESFKKINSTTLIP